MILWLDSALAQVRRVLRSVNNTERKLQIRQKLFGKNRVVAESMKLYPARVDQEKFERHHAGGVRPPARDLDVEWR
jgi:hypothetical protein